MNHYDFSRTYDAIVVGAGNGGLVSGLECARNGLKTLVLEKHNLPGGFASSFVRGRFEFETALHVLADMGPPDDRGSLGRFFDSLGLDVEWADVPEAYRLITTNDPEGNLDVIMPFGVDAYIDKMEEYVPGSRESVTKYMDLCKEVYGALMYLEQNKGNVDRKVLLNEYGNFIRTCPYSQQQVLDALKMPRKAQRILNAYWTYLAAPMSRLNFTIFGVMVYILLRRGACIPKLRSHEISVALDRKIREHGGEVQYNTRVENILVENGRVVGVKTESGEYIGAGHVIANASEHTVYGRLIHPKTEVPESARKICNARILGPVGGFVVYLGLNRSAEELGITEYEYLVYDSMDTEDCYEAFSTRGRTKAQATACINKVIPDCSPPGTCIISFTVLNDGYRWNDVTPETYFDVKTRIAEEILDEFEKGTGIGLRPYIEEIEIATPQTFAHFNGKYNGCIYGYELEPWDSVIPKAMTIDDDDEFPIKGLRFTGGFARRSQGFSSCYLDGSIQGLLTTRNFKEGR